MITKSFDITLDIKNNATVKYNNIVLVSGDVNVYNFNIYMKDDGNVLDLSEVDHAWIIFKKSDGNVVQGDLTISDAINGLMTYTLGTEEIAKGGTVLAEVELYGVSNEQLTTSRFEFFVRDELNNDNAVQSSTQYSVLTTLIDDVENSEATRQANENIRIQNENERITGYQKMIQDSYIVPKSPVTTYDDIATTYPTPENGWTTRVIDTGKLYRYNSETSQWEWIDTITTSSYDVLLNEIQSSQTTPEIHNTSSIFSAGTGKNESSQDVDVSSSIVEGQFSNVKISGRTVYNGFGNKGDCEDTADFLTGYGTPTLTLDSINKVFGNNSLRIQATTNSHGTGLSFKGQAGKYYLLSMYYRVVQGTLKNNIYDQTNAIIIQGDVNLTSNTNFIRHGIKIAVAQDSEDIRWLLKQSGDTALDCNIDGVAVYEITQDEYNNLTVEELMERYQWHNGTKSTVSAYKIKTHGKNAFPYSITDLKTRNDGKIGANYYSVTLKVKPNTDYVAQVDVAEVLGSGYFIYIKGKTDDYMHFGATGTRYATTKSNDDGTITLGIYKWDAVAPYDVNKLSNLMLSEGTSPNTYEEYKGNECYIYATDENGNIIKLNSLMNGTKDEVNVDEGKLYKRTGSRRDIHTLTGWTEDTAWETTDTLVFVLGNVAPLSENTSKTLNNATLRIGGVEFVCRNNDELFPREDDVFSITNGILRVKILKSRLSTLDVAGFEAWLQAQGSSSLIYQLANPITYNIEGITPLNVYPNGTIIVEPYLRKALQYNATTGNGLDFSIKVSEIEKIKDSLGNEIDLTNVTLASDGMSATITGASDGEEYVVYAYIDTAESTIPTSVLTYPMNSKAQILNNNASIQQHSKAIIDLQDKVDILILNMLS